MLIKVGDCVNIQLEREPARGIFVGCGSSGGIYVINIEEYLRTGGNVEIDTVDPFTISPITMDIQADWIKEKPEITSVIDQHSRMFLNLALNEPQIRAIPAYIM